MEVINLSEFNSIINNILFELRDVEIQKDRERFRNNIKKLGCLIGYEISKTLNFFKEKVKTPFEEIEINIIKDQPVLATILRAGLPLLDGLLTVFTNSDCAFISAKRKSNSDNEIYIKIEYISTPKIENKILILCDPMLATGYSIKEVYYALLKYGEPAYTHIASIISSKPGIEYLKNNLPKNVSIWTTAIDESLNSKAYIVPGLGDAGDLSYGKSF